MSRETHFSNPHDRRLVRNAAQVLAREEKRQGVETAGLQERQSMTHSVSQVPALTARKRCGHLVISHVAALDAEAAGTRRVDAQGAFRCGKASGHSGLHEARVTSRKVLRW